MTEGLERLKRKWGIIHATTTKLLTRLEEEVGKERPDTNKILEFLTILSSKEESLLDLDNGIEALRHLYDECEIQIRSLESLGVQSDTYGCLLCPVLLQLIPEDIALAYTHQPNSTNEWKVPELIQFLQNKVQSREQALQLTRPGHASKDPSPQHKHVEMWERGLSWDEPLPTDLTEKWEQWCSELPLIHLVAIPRWYHIETEQESHTVKLHVYCDASEKAYSAVAYLQGQNKQAETVTSFVASKSRVAPLKKMTLPRLELMGALIGARLGHSLLKPLNMEKNQLNMWMDSMITLHWIRSSAQRWKPFVANRVTEIQGLTNPDSWSHCAGEMNPADLPTRGQHAQSLIESQLWWSGPTSLSTSEKELDIDNDCGE
ncbi:uncharacterized protein LOC111581998 [Amphiprion ocellaris]|uniref:uncharacterized protein LOC111581998 n=1 Tax=Amphiprion ocellaris TaxID=80972 RepID=UPI002410C398|nr:uncharacterized protein LOC111581998 [Amphiprion ocellaris]